MFNLPAVKILTVLRRNFFGGLSKEWQHGNWLSQIIHIPFRNILFNV